jgi:type IV pilus assembly protein PilM
VGLDIGSEHIRAVEVSGANTAKPTVVKLGEVDVPAGAIRRGEVLSERIPDVTAAIKQLWSQARFGSKRVVLGIGGPRVMARDLTIPAVPLEHVRESLAFQVQDTLPMPVEDALLDFYPIAESSTPQGEMMSGLLVAAVREAVLANVEAATKAGLKVANVDFVPFALLRALGGGSSGSVLYVSVGAKTTNLVVAQGQVPLLVRILPIGGDDVDGSLIKKFSYSAENARAAKLAYGMSPIGVPIEQQPLVTTMAEAGADLLASIRDTASYFQTSRPDVPLRSVVFSGGGSRLRGFGDALREMSGLDTSLGSTTSAAQFPRSRKGSLTAEARDDFTVALGLAVGSGV